MNLRWTNQYFDMREGHEVLDLVRSAEEALERLATVAENGRAYDLMVCFWGDESGKESAQPQAVTLLGEMRSRSIGVPVVVFAEFSRSGSGRRSSSRRWDVTTVGKACCARSRWRSIRNPRRPESPRTRRNIAFKESEPCPRASSSFAGRKMRWMRSQQNSRRLGNHPFRRTTR
jgi:hypothetical protein